MKINFRYPLIVISMLLVLSCSNDDNNATTAQPEENALVIKKVKQMTFAGNPLPDISESTYNYDSEQNLISIETVSGLNTYTAQFNYDGDFITSVDYLENDIPDGLTTLFYNGDQLISTLSGNNQDERADYTYENGIIKSLKYYYPAGPDEELVQSEFYTYANGNVSEMRRNDYYFGNYESLTKYTYDGKKNPFKSMNKYLKLTLSNEGFNGLSLSNPILKRVFSPMNEATPEEYYYELIYNSDNYPTSIKRFTQDNQIISETVIEYQ